MARHTHGRSARRLGLRRHRAGIGFQKLEDRCLLATLTVGGGGTFSTIQQAVNSARSGDIIEVAGGTYAESVNLALMGSAVGRSPGNLQLRGTGPGVVIASPGGPALFNSAAFRGNLTLDRLTLQSATATAASDSGIVLDNYNGNLLVTNVLVQDVQDTGIQIANSSGTLILQDNEVSDGGTGAGDHGIELNQVTGIAVVTDNAVRDVTDDGIVILLSGSGQLAANVSDNVVAGDPVNFLSTNGGIRAEVSGTARLDLIADGNGLDDLDESALDVIVRDSAQFQGRLDGNIIFNNNQGTTIRLRFQDNARGSLSFDDNTISDTRSDAMQISLGGSARLNAHLQNNLFFNIGDGAGDDALVVTADANSSGALNLLLNFNDFVTVRGIGTSIEGLGSTIYNLTLTENSYSDVNTASGTAAVLIAKASATVAAEFNLDLADNTVNQSNQGDYRFEQRGTGPFRLEGSEATVQEQVENTNTGQLSLSGTVTLVSPGLFDETVPLLLGDLVWRDDNGDGIQGSSETGLANVQITLSGNETASGNAVQRTTISDARGKYQFSGLLPGAYTLELAPRFGFTITQPQQGGNPELDSDFARATRRAQVTLTAETNNFSLDAGLIRNWQNPVLPVDVNNDGLVAPVDALVVINVLNSSGSGPLSLPPLPPDEPPPFLDVNGDTLVAPVDVLQVVNFLNSGGNGEGEGADGHGPAGQVGVSASSSAESRPSSDPQPLPEPWRHHHLSSGDQWLDLLAEDWLRRRRTDYTWNRSS
ncbi:MAG: hypothetical protein J5I93_23115 [Pirellulaceae bacterium]|nr:hypothetical protein [Pirellulaceae bacterium]